MAFCKSADQQTITCNMRNIGGKSVDSVIAGASGAKGVVYNVSYEISEEELKVRLKGGRVVKATHMGKREERESSAVLLTFQGDELLEKDSDCWLTVSYSASESRHIKDHR